MSADLEFQTALRALLIGWPAMAALVPAASILDTGARPFPSPCIIMGEAQDLDPQQDVARKALTQFHTLHVWKEESASTGIKAIMRAVRDALRTRPAMAGDYRCSDARVTSTRAMRDPDGKTAHGVVMIEARLWRAVP